MRHLLIPTCALLAACAAPPDDAGDDAPPPSAAVEDTATDADAGSAAARAGVEGRTAQLSRAFASGSADSVALIFADDAHEFLLNREPLAGRDAIRDFWAQALTWGDWAFDLETRDVAARGDLAVERGTFALTFTAGPDAPPEVASFEDRGNYLAQWRRGTDGAWRIVVHAPVSEMPLPAPPAE